MKKGGAILADVRKSGLRLPPLGLDMVGASEQVRGRLALTMCLFALGFSIIALRLVLLAMTPAEATGAVYGAERALAASRPQIFDRNGELLATDIKTASLYAEPRKILDPDEATEKLTALFADLDPVELRAELSSRKAFFLVKRELTPAQKQDAHQLGLPGIGFISESRRLYPAGSMASHVLGQVTVDHRGLTGIERQIDMNGLETLQDAGLTADSALEPVTLSIDLKAQHSLRDELEQAMEAYKAQGAAGIILNARTGEVVAMTSLPDFDPNEGAQVLDKEHLNRTVTGVYEHGSIFKVFTMAMALDYGVATMDSTYDVRKPIRVASFSIDDFHAQRRILTLPEVFTYSSNIGSAKMATDVGVERHKAFFRKLGLMDRLRTELPESAAPLLPGRWTGLSTMTIAFGHGISVTPLQVAAAAAALINGGHWIPPTVLPRTQGEAMELARTVVKPKTSEQVRYLMRLNAQEGSGRKADAKGYRVGGKTGTAEKSIGGRYVKDRLLTSFLAAFPMDDPQYVILLMLDEPKPTEETKGFATAGWNAAPTAGRLIKRIAPMLGVAPRLETAGGTPDKERAFN